MSGRKIKKAIIPAAGLGTRFLPATKTIPKEMLTIVDRPILLYVVEEAVQAGIEDIVLIQGRGKNAIEDFFDTSYELEEALTRTNKIELLQEIQKIKNLANLISIRQKYPLGLGHAVFTAKPIVGDEPFALLLGDEIVVSEPHQSNVTAQLCDLYETHKQSCVAVMKVPLEEVNKYGIISGRPLRDRIFQVESLVEKPQPKPGISQLALPGRYVFEKEIFKYLSETSPGIQGEIQLTDAMNKMTQQHGMLALQIREKRYDTGDKMGFLKANIELALSRPDLRNELQNYLKDLIKNFEP
ncbi:MAG: UTP--glucose-1-phosphate uridylyltransferase GalU [Bdellovibrionales bacterium]|nr:UTP--glucose-1-phosphate uridylyltransferase GalU [Bdellovibrionales bacterium]